MLFVELRRMFWAIVFTGALIVIAAALAGCSESPRWIIVEKSGESHPCLYGLVWMVEQEQMLCRVDTKDGGFVEHIVPVALISYVDWR